MYHLRVVVVGEVGDSVDAKRRAVAEEECKKDYNVYKTEAYRDCKKIKGW